MKTIYLDVLIVLNIYVNFFLLKATAKFTHISLKTGRCIVSSVTGSVFSLTILLPDEGFIFSALIKLAAAGIIVLLAFGLKDKKSFIRLIIYFYIVNFIFAGITGFMYMMFNPTFMTINNTYFYIDFSLLSLVIFTAISYFIVSAVRRLIDRGNDTSDKYDITIYYNNTQISCTALADTGNSLTDSFTGLPVIICPGNIFNDEFNLMEYNEEELIQKHGLRLIPYSTIGNSGIIPVFKPEKLLITDRETNRKFISEALIGITDRDIPIIFNPKLLF